MPNRLAPSLVDLGSRPAPYSRYPDQHQPQHSSPYAVQSSASRAAAVADSLRNFLLDTYTYVNDGLPTPDESPADASGHVDSFEFGLPGPSTSPAITTPTLDGSSTDAELYLPEPSSSPNTVGFNEPQLPLVFGAD
ncbi:hypothetical protein BC834DRAFT_309721 [Gloeopeniophorella convolvens]|nr:hypothetical protein BC834DRAFT_309721 [Gloeopeniophorella convolvens]